MKQRSAYVPELDGLRAVAVIAVLLFHSEPNGLVSGGFVGVDIFFVLSGYFTARILVQEYGTTGSVDLLAFWRRRALRLLPALIVVVGATLLAVWTLWAPIDRAAIAATAKAVLSGTANNAFARETVNYFAGADSPFLHTWSLGVELQVSLFGPLLFAALATLGGWRTAPAPDGDRTRRLAALARGVGMGLAIAGALSLGAAIVWTTTSPAWAFFGAAARAWEFVAGALLALLLPTDAVAAEARRRSKGTTTPRRGSPSVICEVAEPGGRRRLPP